MESFIEVAVPQNLSASDFTSTEFRVSWDRGSDRAGAIAGYNLYYYSNTPSTEQAVRINGPDNTNYLLTGLTRGTVYHIRVSARDGLGQESHRTDTKKFKTRKYPCETCKEIAKKLTANDLVLPLTQDLKNCKDKFMVAVNALVNEKGGYIVIHSQHDHLVGKFDQQVDDSLKRLIPDQSSYHSYFSRYITDDGNHVVYRVKPRFGRRPLSILKYHTRVSLNCCVLEPTQGEFQNLLTEASLTADEEEDSDEDDSDDEDDDSDGEDDSEDEEDDRMEGFMTSLVKGERIMFGSVPLQEDIRTQAKCPQNANTRGGRSTDTNGVQGLLTKLWNNFEITHYISAFSKVRYGGSTYVGVEEKSKAMFFCEGFELSDDDKNRLEREILSKIERTTLCVGTTMPQQLVSVRFHRVRNSAEDTEAEGGKQRYIVQIKVRRYKHGLIFHAPGQNLDTDGKGPELYRCPDRSMKPERVTLEDWLKYSDDLQSMHVYRVQP